MWSEAGLLRVVTLLESLDTVQVEVKGARGRLVGPLEADAIVIRHPRATVRIEGFAADYEPGSVLLGRITARQVRARRISARVLPRTESAAGPPVFMPRWLTAVIEDAAIGELEIQSPGGTVLQLREVTASATLTRSRIRFEGARADAGNWAVSGGSGRLLAREPLALEAQADWTLLSDKSLRGEARARGDLGQLEVSARMTAPGAATSAITLTDLTGAMRWRASGELTRLDLEQWWQPVAFGPLDANFTAGGDLQSYGLSGRMRGAGLPAAGIGVEASFSYQDGWVDIASLVLRGPGQARVETRGRVRPAAMPWLELESGWQDLAWPLTGKATVKSANGRLQLQGDWPLEYRIEGAFAAPGLPAAQGWAAGLVTDDQLVVREASFATLRGQVEAAGMIGFGDRPAWTVDGSAADLDPSRLREGLAGRLSFRFAASGLGLDEATSWAGAITALSGSFRGQRAAGGGLVRHRAGRTEFEQVALQLGPAQLALNGIYGEERRLQATLVAGDLSGFLPELAGSIRASLMVSGPTLDLAFSGRDLAWKEHRAAVLSADARLDLDGNAQSWARIRSAGMVLAGQSLTNTRLSFDGLPGEHRVELRAGAGEDALELTGSGAWLDGRYELRADRIAAAGPRLPPYQLESPTRLVLSAERMELATACFVNGPRRICTDARWERDRGWSLRAGTEAFPLEALDLKVPGRPRYSGLLYADARMSGLPGQPWLAELRAEIRDALLEYRAPSGRPQSVVLGRTRLSVSSEATRHVLSLRLEGASDADLNAELVATRVEDAAISELPLAGRIRGSTRQLDLLPLLVGDIDSALGRLAIDLTVAGRLSDPLLQGQVRLTEGALDFYQANLRLRDIDATLSLDQSRLGVKASANAGEGSLALDGWMGWRARRLDGDLTLKGDRLLVVNVPEARIFASPDLRFQLDDRRVTVSGTVTVPEARIEPAETANAVLVSSDERIISADTAADGGGRLEVYSDIRLVLGDKVTVDAYGLSGRVTGGVRTRSSPREAAVGSGELEIVEGRYRAYTRELDVERGKLLFAGGPVADPGVDLRASRKLPGRKVGVLVRGLLRKPEISLYSEPPLPQAQIASLLIVGQTLDSLQDSDREGLDAGRASLAAQGGALVAGQLGRYVGLDEVGVTQDSADSTALSLGKFLSPRLYVSYGISLVDEINTLKLRYTIGDNWVVRLESGRESAADIEYRIER